MSAEIIDTSYPYNQRQMDETPTPVQQFFAGTNVFITGGTGFLGKMLINKILTACPNINTVYLLVRKKKGKDVQTRVDEIFDGTIFESSTFRHKIIGIAGDCMMPGLGLTSIDKNVLVKNVNIVFHMAATVRFDEKLKIAMQINVQACKDVLQICSEMLHLRSLVHVSTAYTHCPLPRIEERFYAPPIDSGKLLVLTECASDKLLESITPILLDAWPNTYTFTKAIAEDVVQQHGRGMPVGMFRPGIVISTYKEPVAGWIDNFYGPTGAIAGASTGVIRTLRCNPAMQANMVPVDLCVNGIISAAWDVSRRYNSRQHSGAAIPVYNYCASADNVMTWGDFTTKATKFGLMYPTLKSIWYLCYTNNPNRAVHLLYILFLHYLPAVLIDAFAMVIGKKPRLLKTYKKIHRFMNVIEYFSMRQWDFQMDNMQALWRQLGPRDQELFNFDMSTLDWENFLHHYYRGIRQYLLKDAMDTLPEAMARYRRMYWLHQAVKVLMLGAALRLLAWLVGGWFGLSY